METLVHETLSAAFIEAVFCHVTKDLTLSLPTLISDGHIAKVVRFLAIRTPFAFKRSQ